ncbi:LysR substrate-binding domain-containing protein [Roseibium aggregatum]|uniref:LysR family transcriptional regulator n=1 Tax=Roseibium aggregatum TaxID=187304 RepID=A0A939EGV6_9HYPH|nr:LysR substrate-binding domain-containing protein [Roseibium aggregatum]MBN9671304.1 LysR family transcriptional regulator [Roseibium aggregatum]
MDSLPNLLWLRSFEAASRLGSFTAAGVELGLTQAAVSGHISALETRLGHALFHRTTRKVDLTESGRAYLPAVRKALQDLAKSTENLFGGKISGAVTLRAPISVATLVIAPALAAFLESQPELNIRLLSAIWADTALETNIDFEIRLGAGQWPGCQAEKLGDDFVVPVCSPFLAKGLKTPADLLKLPRAHILGFDDHWPRFFETLALPVHSPTPSVTVDTSIAALEWVSSGGGAALLLERAARPLAASGRIAIPFKEKIPLGQGHYLIHRQNAPPSRPAVRVTENWLRELFGS